MARNGRQVMGGPGWEQVQRRDQGGRPELTRERENHNPQELLLFALSLLPWMPSSVNSLDMSLIWKVPL